jgi:hypothetical protein
MFFYTRRPHSSPSSVDVATASAPSPPRLARSSLVPRDASVVFRVVAWRTATTSGENTKPSAKKTERTLLWETARVADTAVVVVVVLVVAYILLGSESDVESPSSSASSSGSLS